MAIEIERKFLLANENWKYLVVRTVHVRDGLIASYNGRKARVRIADGAATLAIKGPRSGISRDEFEYPIPVQDAEDMMAGMCDHLHIEKLRHYVPHEDLFWEIDVYQGELAGIVLAEIEMLSEDYPLVVPDWIGAEVTGDARYKKINMLNSRLAARRTG